MGKKNFTDKQQLACSSRTVSPDEHTGFACSSRTVSPDEQCYRLICASCTHVPLGTQVFQLLQAASKQRSVPWCCRCGMKRKNVLQSLFIKDILPSTDSLRIRCHGRATCLCIKTVCVVNSCHVQRCGRCRRVSFNTKTHNGLASSPASSFENRM